MANKDLIIAPIGEAALVLVVAAVGWGVHQPMIFTSLGPTAYEMIETPERKSAAPYNVIIGHAIAIAAGFAALFVTGAWYSPKVSDAGVPLLRVWAAVLAALLTVFFTLLVRATQPAALSTTLLISLGTMQAPHDAAVIFAAVLVMVAIGEPLRRLRLRHRET